MSSIPRPRRMARSRSGRGKRSVPPRVVASSSWSVRQVRNGNPPTSRISDSACPSNRWDSSWAASLCCRAGERSGLKTITVLPSTSNVHAEVANADAEVRADGGGNPFGLRAKPPSHAHMRPESSKAARMSLISEARRSGTPRLMTDAARKWRAMGSSDCVGVSSARAWYVLRMTAAICSAASGLSAGSVTRCSIASSRGLWLRRVTGAKNSAGLAPSHAHKLVKVARSGWAPASTRLRVEKLTRADAAAWPARSAAYAGRRTSSCTARCGWSPGAPPGHPVGCHRPRWR
jgi:hypothetical protein